MSGPILPFPTSRTICDGVVETTQVNDPRYTQTVPAFPDERADRSEILAALVGAVTILAEVKDPIGRAYRLGLIARIRNILARERAALGL